MQIHGQFVRRFVMGSVSLIASLVTGVFSASHASAAISNGIIDIAPSGGQCMSSGSIDAFDAGWSWTKPTLEVSADNGSTWNSATTYVSPTAVQYGATVCRDVTSSGNKYWFIVQPANGSTDDLGAEGLTLTFRVTIPIKSGDNLTRLTGYSEVVSFVESNSAAVVITKASPVAKVDYGNISDPAGVAAFVAAHTECASYNTMQTIIQCPVSKATRDRIATVTQHIDFSTAALSTWQSMQKGFWLGANVNGYNVTMTCGALGGDSSTSGSSTGGNGGSTDGGANRPVSSQAENTSSLPVIDVSVTGTPHFKADGATLNKGSLKAFIPKDVALKCFGDGKPETTLAMVASALSVVRTEATEGTSKPTFTASAVSSPVEGVMIAVPEMTFSNPKYSVTSSLAAQNLAVLVNNNSGGSGITGVVTTPTVATKNTMKTAIVGTKATITVTLLRAGSFKVYKTYKKKKTLVKTVKGKKGANKVVTTYAKGMTFSAVDAKGKSIAKVVASSLERAFF